MQPTARPNRMTIDLQNYKQPWIDYSSAHGTTPSEAFRMVVAKLTNGASFENREREVIEHGKVRREIRLTNAELRAAEVLAAKEGFAFSRWLVALLRARLTSTAQLGQQELELLARSNMQVLAVGRNLNQIAKAMQTNTSDQNECPIELIEAVSILIKEHASMVAKVLASNMQRWSVK